MRLPQLRIGDIDHAAPEFWFGQMFLPYAEMLAIKRRELGCHPGFCVDTVRDAGDRHLVHRHANPDVFPKRSGDISMHLAHAISLQTATQRPEQTTTLLLRNSRAITSCYD